MNKLKKAALSVIATRLAEQQIKALQDTFMALDKNSDGMLTYSELREGLEKSGIKDIPTDLKAIMEDLDSDASGCIDYTEFLAASLDHKEQVQEKVCWAAFCVFDK